MSLAIGVFAIAEILPNVEAGEEASLLKVPKGLRNLMPSWEELKACRFAVLNGSITGFIIGMLPGAGFHDRVLRLLRHREGGLRSIRNASATARRKALPRRKAPTMPIPAARCCRC